MKYYLSTSTLSLILISCQSKPEAPKLENAEVIAKIGSQNILSTDFMAEMKRIEEKSLQVPSTHLQKKEFLDQIINIELLYSKALKEGFDKSLSFRKKLVEAYIDEISRRAEDEISEADLRAHYEKNRKLYDQIAARHILLKTTPQMSEKEKVGVFEKLSEIREKLIKSPQEFQDYARRYSEDSTRQQGGDLGYFNAEMMVPSFSKAAFELKEINQISPVIGTNFGYHIIQLRADRRGFENHVNEIRELIIQQSKRNKFDQEVAKLRNETKIEIYEDNLLKLSPLPEIIETDPEEILPQKIKKESP